MSALGQKQTFTYDSRLGFIEGQLTAISGRSEELKKATKKPPFYNQCKLIFYAFLRRAKPTKPIKPEPNNHTAAGTGTVVGVPTTR